MAAATAEPLADDVKSEETEALLQDVIKIFSEPADVANIRESGRALAELSAAMDQKHKEMLESIKELTGRVGRSKAEHAERSSVMLDPTQKQQLLAEKTRVEDNIRRLMLETEGLKQRISTTEGKANELSAQEQQLRQQEAQEIKRARHTISLYANISSIRWDYSSGLIKGWVTSSGRGGGGRSAAAAGMKAFEMDPQRHNEYAVTNYLWDLMDSC